MRNKSTRDSIKIDENISCERFCIELSMMWRRYAPEMSFMQFINNFQAWLGNDGFYLEDIEVYNKLKEFCKIKEQLKF